MLPALDEEVRELVEFPLGGKAELMEEVWGWADARGTRTLDSHVKALRAKIGAERLRTVHGVGYALEAQDAR